MAVTSKRADTELAHHHVSPGSWGAEKNSLRPSFMDWSYSGVVAVTSRTADPELSLPSSEVIEKVGIVVLLSLDVSFLTKNNMASAIKFTLIPLFVRGLNVETD